MPWFQVGALAVSAYMGHKAKKKAQKQQDAANAQGDESIALQREGLDFSKEQYGDWKEKYDPVYDDMMDEIDSGITPDYADIAGDINDSFDSAQGMERRQLQRYGVKPQDGAYGKSERDYAINRSTAHSGIRNKARQDSAGEKFRRLSGVHNTLQGVGTSLAGQVGNSYSRTGGAMNSQANRMTNQANTNYERGMDDAAGWGAAVGGVDWKGAWNSAKSWSDVALKENVKLVGWKDGMNIYEWDWNDTAKAMGISDQPTTGLLAQEHLDSGFVHKADNGYLYIDYPGLIKSRRVN
jgi:hypothetical protein